MNRILLLCFVCNFNICSAQTKWFEIPSSSFNTEQLESDDSEDAFSYLLQNQKNSGTYSVQSFSMSSQITLGDYLQFVHEERKLKGSKYADFLLPEPSAFNSNHKYNEYLTNAEYKLQPVAGISWKNAMRYVTWRNANKRNDEKEFEQFRLPSVTEWQAAFLYLSNTRKTSDFNILADWTSECHDESNYKFMHDLNIDYQCESVPCNPNSMKRKTVIGNSWLHGPVKEKLPMHYYGYQDSGYAHIGFRLVRTILHKSGNTESSENLTLNDRALIHYPKEKKIEYVPGDTVEYVAREWKVKLVKKENLMTGAYLSWYSNGILKTKGQYLFNQKAGDWYFYDSKGMLVLQRHYINDLIYKDMFPKASNKLAAFFKDEPLYSIARRSDKEPYSFPVVNESNIFYSKRYWLKNVQIQNLWSPLKEGIQNKSITLFPTDILNITDSARVTKINSLPEEAEITGYRIKLDFYFDLKYMMCFHQVIGIAPEIKTPEGTSVLGWIFYPQIREILAQKCTKPKEYPTNIQHLDDLIFFRYYSGDVYKVSNVYDREEPKEIDPFITWLELLETEHSLLISLYKK